jgi:hypothetical protein
MVFSRISGAKASVGASAKATKAADAEATIKVGAGAARDGLGPADVARLPQMRVTFRGAGSLGDRGGAISLFEVRLSFSHTNSMRTTPVFG